MKSIYDYTQEQLIDEFLELGEKKLEQRKFLNGCILKM